VGGRKFLIPGSPIRFQTRHFNASTLFQPDLRVRGGGSIVHTIVGKVRLFGRGSTVPPAAMDDTKERWRNWHCCYHSGDCEDGRHIGVCRCVLMCTAALQQSAALLSLRLRKPQFRPVSTRLSSAAAWIERSHPARSSFLYRSIYCNIRLYRA
jgi:hypothetical protein